MAADPKRLAEALAYRQRLAQFVPQPAGTTPERPQAQSTRSQLENLSIGLGEGLTNQLEGVKGVITDPIGTAKGTYEAVRGVVRDPSVLADALRYTADKAMSGPLGAGEVIGEMLGPMRTRETPVMQEIDVYHGSPHRFEEFDASKIGTGEGAQAYGHGIYFAENPDVARTYRQIPEFDDTGLGGYVMPRAASDEILALYNDAQKLNDANWESGLGEASIKVYNEILHGEYGPQQLKKKVEQWYWDDPEKLAEAQDAVRKAAEVESRYKGNLYKADLPDEMVDRMLDWDAPVDESFSARIMAAVRKNDELNAGDFEDALGLSDSYFGQPEDGRAVYQLLKSSFKSDAKASEFLREAGIPGIKYLDAGSRGQGGSGTRNFVVFPGEEKKVKILKRE